MGPMLLRVGVLSVCVLVMCVLPIVSGRVELPYFRASNCYLLPVMFVCVCVAENLKYWTECLENAK